MGFGIALAGGGARGAAHVGVLRALEEENLRPSAVAGTSAGGIVAGLYAAGLSPGRMWELVISLTRNGNRLLDPDCKGIVRTVFQLLLWRPISLQSLLKGDRLEHFLCQLTGGRSVKETALPVLIPAVDIQSGDTVVYTGTPGRAMPHVRWQTEISLCRAMRASAAVPAVFRPVMEGDFCLVDGGIANNLPVDLLLATGEKRVLAVDVSEEYEMPEKHNLVEIASHSFTIITTRLKEQTARGERLLLKPQLPEKADLLSFDKMEACMNAAYEATKEQMPTIRYLFG